MQRPVSWKAARSYRYLSSASAVLPRCSCCGSLFHKLDRKLPGFHYEHTNNNAQSTTSVRKKDTEDFLKRISQLDDAKLNVLGGPQLIKELEHEVQHGSPVKRRADNQRQKKDLVRNKVCLRCVDVARGSVVPITLSADRPLTEWIQGSSSQSTLVHVVDAADFPTSMCTDLLSLRSRRAKLLWVINRIDLVVPTLTMVKQRLTGYFASQMSKLDVKLDDVCLVSAKKGWGLPELYTRLGSANYFLGETNVGKSRLVSELLRYTEAKTNPAVGHAKTYGYFPWLTQNQIEYNGSRLLVDCSSFRDSKGRNLEQDTSRLKSELYLHLKPRMLRYVVSGDTAFGTSGRLDPSKYVTSTHCVSLGGLVILQVHQEEGATVKPRIIVWPSMGDCVRKLRSFQSLEKVCQLATTQLNDHESWFFCSPQTHRDHPYREVGEYSIYGDGLNLAIRGLGSVQVHVSGRIPANGVKIKVFAPAFVHLIRRDSLTPYVKTISSHMNTLL